jgi:hypothetical protein
MRSCPSCYYHGGHYYHRTYFIIYMGTPYRCYSCGKSTEQDYNSITMKVPAVQGEATLLVNDLVYSNGTQAVAGAGTGAAFSAAVAGIRDSAGTELTKQFVADVAALVGGGYSLAGQSMAGVAVPTDTIIITNVSRAVPAPKDTSWAYNWVPAPTVGIALKIQWVILTVNSEHLRRQGHYVTNKDMQIDVLQAIQRTCRGKDGSARMIKERGYLLWHCLERVQRTRIELDSEVGGVAREAPDDGTTSSKVAFLVFCGGCLCISMEIARRRWRHSQNMHAAAAADLARFREVRLSAANIVSRGYVHTRRGQSLHEVQRRRACSALSASNYPHDGSDEDEDEGRPPGPALAPAQLFPTTHGGVTATHIRAVPVGVTVPLAEAVVVKATTWPPVSIGAAAAASVEVRGATIHRAAPVVASFKVEEDAATICLPQSSTQTPPRPAAAIRMSAVEDDEADYQGDAHGDHAGDGADATTLCMSRESPRAGTANPLAADADADANVAAEFFRRQREQQRGAQ